MNSAHNVKKEVSIVYRFCVALKVHFVGIIFPKELCALVVFHRDCTEPWSNKKSTHRKLIRSSVFELWINFWIKRRIENHALDIYWILDLLAHSLEDALLCNFGWYFLIVMYAHLITCKLKFWWFLLESHFWNGVLKDIHNGEMRLSSAN